MNWTKQCLIALFICYFTVGNLMGQTDQFTERAPQQKLYSELIDKAPKEKVVAIPSDDMFDLVFEYPCAIGDGEAGIETDGNYIYTTKWNGSEFYKYEINGTFLEAFTIPGVSNNRDLAYDGTYFFGGAGSPTVYEIDFENAILISSFTAPTDVRAIAYYENDDSFYANNWGSNIVKFDKTGANLGSFNVGPMGDSYYGFEIDVFCYPVYLYGYAQVGASQNEIIEIDFINGYETGVYFDVGSVINVGSGIAGGLCAHHFGGDEILIGISQNEVIWGLELCVGGIPNNDVGIHSIVEPSSGVGNFTNNEIVTVSIKNYGWNPQSDIIVSFTYNGGSPYYDTAFTTINFNESYNHTFDTIIDMTTGNIHVYESCTHLADDEYVFNDCKTKVLEGGQYGDLEGFVTQNINGTPIEGATIDIDEGLYSTTTTSTGYYSIVGMNAGNWQLVCSKPGYNIDTVNVTITGGNSTIQDFVLTAPIINVFPTSLSVGIEPYMTAMDTLVISNLGDGPMDWSAAIQYLTEDTKELFDLIWETPVGIGGGEAGIETNGNYIYTTKWNGSGEFYRYTMDGIYLAQILIPETAGTRDMAFDGTSFFGGAASTTVFEMDLDNEILIGSFTAPASCRAIAYNNYEDVFYANNWGSNIVKFDKSGNYIDEFTTGPVGLNYYGFAFDGISSGGPYLWGYAHVGNSNNELIQIQLPSGLETGVYFDVGTLVTTNASNAGGLAIDEHIVQDSYSFLGLVQNEMIWAIELAPEPWLEIDSTSGTLDPGMSDQVIVYFDPSEILVGTVKTANINLSSDPVTPPLSVPVSMTVGIPGLGYIEGHVTLNGIMPYNTGTVTEVEISANGPGIFTTSPDTAGFYQAYVYSGIYEISASLYGYEYILVSDTVFPDSTVTIDFELPCINGIITGTVSDIQGGAPIPGAYVELQGTSFETYTGPDGSYELIVEDGLYDVKVSFPGYTPLYSDNLIITAQNTIIHDFQMSIAEDIILVCDLDPTPTGQDLVPILENLLPGSQVEYTTTIDGFPLNGNVETVFLLLGIFSNNYVLTEDDAIIFTTWLDNYDDRNLYMEGGDTWYYDVSTSLHAYFNINGLSDGSGDLVHLDGTASYWSGYMWGYFGENNFIDHIEAIPPAINILESSQMFYFTAVAYDAETYKSVGASHEIMGLTGMSGVESAVSCVLAYFDLFGWGSGTLDGYLTDCVTGNPINNATITVGMYTYITGPDGYFYFNIPEGTYVLYYEAAGYCPSVTGETVTIEGGIITTIDNLCLYPAQFEVNPEIIIVTIEPNAITSASVTISNPGVCGIDWSVSVEDASEELFDLQYQYPCAVGGGEAGIETDGDFLYTTMWNGPGVQKYGLDGTFIETLNIGNGIRDLAYDGTYFYGAAASPTVFEMDFDNQQVISTFNAPTEVRAIAYNHNDDAFYANNWGSDITKFDKTGANLGSFPVGPVGDSYYGLAYEDESSYISLWGYAQVGNSENELVHIELPDGTETGVYFDLATVLNGTVSGLAGGLFTHPNLITGMWTIGGLVQNEWLWGLELATAQFWFSLEPVMGILYPDDSEEVILSFSSMELLPGVYEADLVFTTNYETGPHYVHIIMTVEGLSPPINLYAEFECTDICLSWEIPAGADPDCFNVYRDGELIADCITFDFCDSLLIPEVEYSYYITAVYNGEESSPSQEIIITIPTPADLVPGDLTLEINNNNVTITGGVPQGCLSPDEYNIYRNSELLAVIPQPVYTDSSITAGFYEYYMTAVYYFGESEPTPPAYIITDVDSEKERRISIFPNPVESFLFIRSDISLKGMQIYNSQGEQVLLSVISGFEKTVDMARYPDGIYFLKIETENSLVLRKIIVR